MCASSGSAAVLLVGLAGESHLQTHLQALRQAVLTGLHRPAVFAVGEGRDAPNLWPLPQLLSHSLRALGLVSATGVPRPAYLPVTVGYRSIPAPTDSSRAASSVGTLGRSKTWIKEGARLQWHKLFEAWQLMEADELASSAPYELVVKLRFDATPLEVL